VHSDYLDLIDGVRTRMPEVQHYVALEGEKAGWLAYESLIQGSPAAFDVPEIAESDLLAINYTSGTTSRPKGVMITHRNAWMNCVGTLAHWPMTPADRYLWTLPMFHANGWTFTWTVTAAGAAHVCLRAVDASQVYALVQRERVTHLCAAPTVLISIANGPAAQRKDLRRGVRVLKPIKVEREGAFAALEPADDRILEFDIQFDSPAIGKQRLAFVFTPGRFRMEIAPARTFGFLSELDALNKVGLAKGASLENTLAIEGDTIVNAERMRFADEFVRHKILDAMGDLALAGGPLIGRFVGHRSGHALNNALLRTLFADAANFAWVEI